MAQALRAKNLIFNQEILAVTFLHNMTKGNTPYQNSAIAQLNKEEGNLLSLSTLAR
jgi:hypothetical protein